MTLIVLSSVSFVMSSDASFREIPASCPDDSCAPRRAGHQPEESVMRTKIVYWCVAVVSDSRGVRVKLFVVYVRAFK